MFCIHNFFNGERERERERERETERERERQRERKELQFLWRTTVMPELELRGGFSLLGIISSFEKWIYRGPNLAAEKVN
jgi:hypothetical protein